MNIYHYRLNNYSENRPKMVSASSSYSPEENSVIFFRHVKRDLGIPSTQQMVRLVDTVLSKIQRGLNKEQSRQFLTMLPGPLQLLAAKNRKTKQVSRPIAHLDELVEDVYE